jgi:hypothetical protein
LCEIVALATELLAWTQLIELAGPARCWEPKRMQLRLYAAAGRLVRCGCRLRLGLAGNCPGMPDIAAAVGRPQTLPSG